MTTPIDTTVSDASRIVVCTRDSLAHFNHGLQPCLQQLPLPGVVIFVHGVNSDGEWYAEAEAGLCAGLNARLARLDENLAHPNGLLAGQLAPAEYMSDLTPDGFLNPLLSPRTLIRGNDSFSPVIRFRYGYKAGATELQQYGNALLLNEQDYWGGGPFANGCTALPDLWHEGLDDGMFLWMHVQHLNPTAERVVYSCPPRPYFVFAAYRLARLVEAIRMKQADVPITIVCHSQGNMVSIAAAFLGDRLPDVSDPHGKTGRCVADAYVLCNPPYSLAENNWTENWSERNVKDAAGRRGRQTLAARRQTLAAFFEIIGAQRATQQDAGLIDRRMANLAHDFSAEPDRAKFGLGGATCGRVTLYCNPHDQVISTTSIQGIGWRGLSVEDIAVTRGAGIFSQRVFAQGFCVGGDANHYDYWADHYQKPKPGSDDFWQPNSPLAEYSVRKGLEADRGKLFSMVLTLLSAPFLIVGMKVAGIRVSALPPVPWKIPIAAPKLQPGFEPESMQFGISYPSFDQGLETQLSAIDRDRGPDRAADDLYANKDAQGNLQSEAGLRYEHHAFLRMQARREGLYKNTDKVVEEDKPETASAKYTAWREEKVRTQLAETIDTHATDHSTIMTNPMHARLALAYDVALGVCDISPTDMRHLRAIADWRMLKNIEDEIARAFSEYFQYGQFRGASVFDWANSSREGSMPSKIVDDRDDALYLRL